MGTRGGYGFKKDGQMKITYCHYDSYPSWLGNNVVRFIKDNSVEEMNKIFDNIVMINEDVPATIEQIKECKKYADSSVSTGALSEWYVLLRHTQGDLNVYKHGLKYMIDNGSLNEDYAYVINLDDNTFEFYKYGKLADKVPLEIADTVF